MLGYSTLCSPCADYGLPKVGFQAIFFSLSTPQEDWGPESIQAYLCNVSLVIAVLWCVMPTNTVSALGCLTCASCMFSPKIDNIAHSKTPISCASTWQLFL